MPISTSVWTCGTCSELAGWDPPIPSPKVAATETRRERAALAALLLLPPEVTPTADSRHRGGPTLEPRLLAESGARSMATEKSPRPQMRVAARAYACRPRRAANAGENDQTVNNQSGQSQGFRIGVEEF